MDSYTKTGAITISQNGDSFSFGIGQAADQFTSSYAVITQQPINTGSWQVVVTGSAANGNIAFGAFANAGISSSILISMGTTASVVQYLRPGKSGETHWNKLPATIFAMASGSVSPVVLQYFIQGA